MPVYHENWLEIRPIPDPPPGISRREAEGTAWRAIVKERLGNDIAITYNASGAPVLSRTPANQTAAEPAEAPTLAKSTAEIAAAEPAGHPGYIGVSHTKGWVAVVWSPEPCAVDIELKTRKLSPASAARVGITPESAASPAPAGTSPDTDPLPPIAAWCAWEALYKYRSVTGDPETNLASETENTPETALVPELIASAAIPADALKVRFHPHPELVIATIF